MTNEKAYERILRILSQDGRNNDARIAEILEYPITKIQSIRKTGQIQSRDYQHIIDKSAQAGIEIMSYDFVADLVAAPVIRGNLKGINNE